MGFCPVFDLNNDKRKSNSKDWCCIDVSSLQRFFSIHYPDWKLGMPKINVMAKKIKLAKKIFARTLLAIAVITHPIWMTVLFLVDGEYLTSILYSKIKRWDISVYKLFRPVWYMLGISFIAPAQTKWHFIKNNGKELNSFSVKHQLMFYNRCTKESKTTVVHRLSKEAILALWNTGGNAEKMLIVENIGIKPEFSDDLLTNMYSSLCEYIKTKSKNYSIIPVEELEHLCAGLRSYEKTEAHLKLDELLGRFNYETMNYCSFNEHTKKVLWMLDKHGKLIILFNDGLTSNKLEELLNKDNFDVLEEYLQKKTLSSELLSILIVHSANSDECATILKKIVIKHNISPEKLMLVYKQNNTKLTTIVEEAIDIYTDINILKNLNYEGLSEAENREKNEARLKLYFNNRKICPLAQEKMTFEQYKMFVATGHKLDTTVAQAMLVTVKNKDYFKRLLEDEWENVTPQIVNIFKTIGYKYEIYLNLLNKKK